MTDLPKNPTHELKAVLAEHLPWHGARIAFLAQFLLALLNAWDRMLRLDTLFGSLKPGECRRLTGRRPVWGCFVRLSALRLEDGGFLFIASSGAPQAGAIDAYAGRWQVETLFC
jgi:hypothetical protein